MLQVFTIATWISANTIMNYNRLTLNISWWNSGVSPPSTKATAGVFSKEHFETLSEIIEVYEADIVGICEVDKSNIDSISTHLQKAYGEKYFVIDLYNQSGNSIDDYCLIINTLKLYQTGTPESLNRKAPGYNNYLKAGHLLHLSLIDGTPLWITVSHWQSRLTYQEENHIRLKLGQALRTSVETILSKHTDPLVILCGDFNDEPFSPSIKELVTSRDMNFVKRRSDTFFNPMWGLMGMNDLTHSGIVHGTYGGTTSYQLTQKLTIDQIMISPAFLKNGWGFYEAGISVLEHSSSSDHAPLVCQLERIS